ncbi:protein C10 isoform X2 [Amphiprion ocellaris]|uniref:protein C10 isoform X2 n=1 Tax=Amphiprion ocellaris TaxID=80972 RepID=UPI002410FF2E|nr:protein C10 isoform X2 [Amphiprion ocellaris]
MNAPVFPNVSFYFCVIVYMMCSQGTIVNENLTLSSFPPLLDMASAPAQQPTLTVEQTRVVLSEVIQAFSVPENAARMEEARESACNDMGKMLQLVLPVATQIQQEVIKAYGFNNEGEGVLKFARLVKMYETQDPEIAAMSAKLKSLLLPPLSTPPIGGAIPAS